MKIHISLLITISLLSVLTLGAREVEVETKRDEDQDEDQDLIEIYEVPDPTDKHQSRQVYGSDFSGYWSNRKTYHYW